MPQYPSLHQRTRSEESDVKIGFDELIDNYSSPYAANAHPQTYAVPTLSTDALGPRRGTTIPLSGKPSISAKSLVSSDDTHEPFPVGYPPPSLPMALAKSEPWWRKLVPDSLACRLYLITVLVETAIDIAIEGELMIRVYEDRDARGLDDVNANRMPVYLSIFALAHVFQFALAVDAVKHRNTLQFGALTIFNALFLVYAIIQIDEIRTSIATSSSSGVISSIPINVLTIIIPCVIGVAELAYIALGWKIYHEFGWKVYKFLGADRKLKKMYVNYQVYECLVKFDVFFWVGFSVQFIWLVLKIEDWEYYLTCAALPLSIVLLVEGHLAARHENKWMMITFLSGCVGAMVYFVFKLVKVQLYKRTDFVDTWKTLTVFSVIAILLLMVTFVMSLLVMHSFGRGLKDALQRNSTAHRRKASVGANAALGSMNPNRMSID
ncbi:hypothetical protein FISHEDRAFT_64356 [Fistulina hepatica ATCC 64428]|uniref:Uncharacterized protein n=1 Tax=Fistulina hepatica ATCC 64428 TaxID=1128425 RepID=A0A0D7AHM2_9AGAR|nr:hypothetical protein FISHEDRAFT_64356 [Fistulina hepatica ATCC 64428]